MKKKGTRRCLHQDTKSLITPSLHLCFALTCCLFVCLFVMNALGKANSTTSNWHSIACMKMYVVVWKKQRCRDGVMSDFHEVTSLHPPSFHRNDFSTCSTHFSFFLCVCAARVDMHAHAHADNAPHV